MLLSEAIRLGAMLGSQAFGIRHGGDGSSCVLGAVEDACGGIKAEKAFPWIFGFATNPVTGDEQPVNVIMAGLNNNGSDFHLSNNPRRSWSRERIADWVESIERERGLIPAAKACETEYEDTAVLTRSGLVLDAPG